MPDQTDPTQPLRITSLSEADGQVLDALLAQRAAGVSSGPMPPGSEARAAAMARLLGLLESYPVEDAGDDLVEKTLARARAARQEQRFAQQVQMLAEPRQTTGASWSQIASAVAVFVIGLSLLMPVLERNRQEAGRVACASNLARTGQALGSYGEANGRAMPRRNSRLGGDWYHVGQQGGDPSQAVTSNTANLYLLVRTRLLTAEDLACPENMHAPAPGKLTDADHDWASPQSVSYSYQNQFGRQTLRFDANSAQIVLADKNPLFVLRDGKLYYDDQAPASAVSLLHQSRGQNVLRMDGASVWMVSPFVVMPDQTQGDDIYRATGVAEYDGDEIPADAADSFLVP
jgi:hypothetical protein